MTRTFPTNTAGSGRLAVADGSSVGASFGYNTGTAVVADPSSILNYPGHTFLSWNTYIDGRGTRWNPGDVFTFPDSDTVLYAQWLDPENPPDTASVTVTLSAPQYQSLVFNQFGIPVTFITMDKDAVLSLAMPAGGENYQWLVDAHEPESGPAIGKLFNFIPQKAGRFTITATATYGGVSHSGDVSVLVTDDYMIGIIPFGRTVNFEQKTWTYENGSRMENGVSTFLLGAYSLGKYEVSYSLWKLVREWSLANGYEIENEGQNGCTTSNGPSGVPNHPVSNISYYDAVVWCNAYSEMTGCAPCYLAPDGAVLRSTSVLRVLMENGSAPTQAAVDGYRLPSEGEWQFAASCNGLYPYNAVSGNMNTCISGDTSTYATYANVGEGETTICGLKIGNTWGLQDMSGNVWEFCVDAFGSSPSLCTVKGGSFNTNDAIDTATVGYREGMEMNATATDSGFRIARTITK